MRVVRESRRVAGLWKGFLRVDEEFQRMVSVSTGSINHISATAY